MSKIMPFSQSNDTKTNFTSINVGPRATRIYNTGSAIFSERPSSAPNVGSSSLSNNRTASAPNARVGIIPINDRMSRIERSDSFKSKLVRLVNAKEYKTFDTIYSKALIVLAILNLIMIIVFFSFYMLSSAPSTTNLYVKNDLITDEFKEKNKEMDTMNAVNKANTIISGIIGVSSLLASIGQFIYVYRHQDFRS